jgi:hypothetical protein
MLQLSKFYFYKASGSIETIKNIPPIKLLVKKDQKRTNNKVNIIRWPFYETSLIFELFFLATYNIYLLYVA